MDCARGVYRFSHGIFLRNQRQPSKKSSERSFSRASGGDPRSWLWKKKILLRERLTPVLTKATMKRTSGLRMAPLCMARRTELSSPHPNPNCRTQPKPNDTRYKKLKEKNRGLYMLLRINMHKQKSSNCLFTWRRRLLLPCPKWHRFVPGSWRLRPCYPLELDRHRHTRE